METVGAADFFDKLFSVENYDFMLQFQDDDHGFHNNCFPFDPTVNPSHDHVNQLLQSDNDESMKFFMISQKEFETSSVFDPDEVIRDISESDQLGKSDLLNQGAEEQTFRDANPKKRTRVSRDGKKNKRNANPKPKKNNNNMTENEEEDKYESNTIMSANNAMQSSSCCSSEDDSTTTTADLKGKTRATRGSATDPQSLYARRRRERINERLRILQSLVPNGTKVDISTMLEEAVHYVKFMQLQIKLLSSDDMWMYSRIAYNGMDMGLYQKMLPNL